MRFFLLGSMAALATACVDSDGLDLSSQEQAERIEIHACQPGYIEVGEGDDIVCVDPWHGGGDGGGGGGVGGEREPSGGGGGIPPSRRPPIPEREDCSGLNHEECYACCDRNLERVDGERCRRIRSPEERATCWSEAEETLGRCQRACPSAPILTLWNP